LVQSLDGALVHQVAAEPVDRVRRVGEQATTLEHFDGPLDLARFRVLRVDLEQSGHGAGISSQRDGRFVRSGRREGSVRERAGSTRVVQAGGDAQSLMASLPPMISMSSFVIAA
jgi:hypothetical protein